MLMHHASAHGNGQRHDAFPHPCQVQAADAARRKREIDGAAVVRRSEARIRAPFVHRDVETAFRQQDGQQGSRKSGADDVDAGHRRQTQAISLSAVAISSTISKISMNRLYSGTGAMRMMSGSRQSQTMP